MSVHIKAIISKIPGISSYGIDLGSMSRIAAAISAEMETDLLKFWFGKLPWREGSSLDLRVCGPFFQHVEKITKSEIVPAIKLPTWTTNQRSKQLLGMPLPKIVLKWAESLIGRLLPAENIAYQCIIIIKIRVLYSYMHKLHENKLVFLMSIWLSISLSEVFPCFTSIPFRSCQIRKLYQAYIDLNFFYQPFLKAFPTFLSKIDLIES